MIVPGFGEVRIEDFTTKENKDNGCHGCFFFQFRKCDIPENKRSRWALDLLLDKKYGNCITNNHIYVIK